MARGPFLFSPSFQSTLWSYQSNSNTKIAQGKRFRRGLLLQAQTRICPPPSWTTVSLGMRMRSILPTMRRRATKRTVPSRAQWCNQQSQSNPKWTTLAYLRYIFLTNSLPRFLSNISGRWLRRTTIVNRPLRPAPEVVSSSKEEGDDGPSALLSAVPGETSAAAPVDRFALGTWSSRTLFTVLTLL
jgi:hypothetical protein